MSRSGREALPDVQKWLGGRTGCPEGTSVCLGVVSRPSRMSGSGGVAIPNVWEWSGVPPRCLGEVGRPSRMS